jgi:hypothetical protein
MHVAGLVVVVKALRESLSAAHYDSLQFTLHDPQYIA